MGEIVERFDPTAEMLALSLRKALLCHSSVAQHAVRRRQGLGVSLSTSEEEMVLTADGRTPVVAGGSKEVVG
jgi:hypothetical protein